MENTIAQITTPKDLLSNIALVEKAGHELNYLMTSSSARHCCFVRCFVSEVPWNVVVSVWTYVCTCSVPHADEVVARECFSVLVKIHLLCMFGCIAFTMLPGHQAHGASTSPINA